MTARATGQSPKVGLETVTTVRTVGGRLLERLFGDGGGLAVCLGTLVLLGASWRVGFFITDSTTVANTLANVADGRLAVVDAPYSLTATGQPGLKAVDGQLYGRNYGHVYLAVPLLWGLDAASALVDLRLLLAAGWSLSVVGLGRVAARLLGRHALGPVGAVAGLCAFLAALALASPLPAVDRPLVALQLSTILVAALAATVTYRLLAWTSGPRVGLVGGLGLILATPVGLWGTVPKRHVLTAAAVLLAAYWFAVSRGTAGRESMLARAGAYGVFGLLAAVHPFEAAFMVAVLAPIDLLTAPSNGLRPLAVVVLVFSLSVAPMLATNAAISGNPMEPPRLLSGAGGGLTPDLGDEATPPARNGDGGDGSTSGGGADGGGDAAGSDPGGGGTGGGEPDGEGNPFTALLDPVVGLVGVVLGRVLWIGDYMVGSLEAGIAALLEPDRLYHVFVRSGWIPDLNYHANDFEAVELAMLEALPVAGALAWLPVVAVGRLRRGTRSLVAGLRDGLGSPVRQTDLLVGSFAVTFVLIYLPMLPLHSMITLRYVLPAMALLVYVVCRLAPVVAAIEAAPRALAAGYLGTVALGTVGVGLVLVVLDPAVGEAVQLHALVGVGTALLAGATAAAWPVHRDARIAALGVAVPAGATTVFLVFAVLAYFPSGRFALDLVRLAASVLPAVG